MKGVIKKLPENAPKWKAREKNANDTKMIGLIQPMLIEIWYRTVGIIFYSLILGHSEFIFS